LKHYAFENAAVRLAGLAATREFLEPMFVHRDQELLIIAMCDDDLRLVRLVSIPGEKDRNLALATASPSSEAKGSLN
jgi:hypothetical protein